MCFAMLFIRLKPLQMFKQQRFVTQIVKIKIEHCDIYKVDDWHYALIETWKELDVCIPGTRSCTLANQDRQTLPHFHCIVIKCLNTCFMFTNTSRISNIEILLSYDLVTIFTINNSSNYLIITIYNQGINIDSSRN